MHADFQSKGFVVAHDFVGKETCALLKEYVEQQLRLDMIEPAWGGPRGSYGEYSTALGETLLNLLAPRVEAVVGRPVSPTFSFLRIYAPGEDLTPHLDRAACEVCVSIHFARWGDGCTGAVDGWPLYCGGEPLACELADAVVFKGSQVEHRRDPNNGSAWGVLSLHYVYSDGPHTAEKYDRRAMLGASKEYLAREIPIPSVLPACGVGPEHWAVWRNVCFVAANDDAFRRRLIAKPVATLKEFGLRWAAKRRPELMHEAGNSLILILPSLDARAPIELVEGCTPLYWRRWVANRIWRASGRSLERHSLQRIVDRVATTCLADGSWDRFHELLQAGLRRDLGIQFKFETVTLHEQEAGNRVRILLPSREALIS
ncbi:MAG TPA: hypothetical protein VM864_08235 [Pyrinomonadaceae bacterium]|jgi:hypothetical protein|nr:hypothetical protein [Pyrinomonadaceae bacterium]